MDPRCARSKSSASGPPCVMSVLSFASVLAFVSVLVFVSLPCPHSMCCVRALVRVLKFPPTFHPPSLRRPSLTPAITPATFFHSGDLHSAAAFLRRPWKQQVIMTKNQKQHEAISAAKIKAKLQDKKKTDMKKKEECHICNNSVKNVNSHVVHCRGGNNALVNVNVTYKKENMVNVADENENIVNIVNHAAENVSIVNLTAENVSIVNLAAENVNIVNLAAENEDIVNFAAEKHVIAEKGRCRD